MYFSTFKRLMTACMALTLVWVTVYFFSSSERTHTEARRRFTGPLPGESGMHQRKPYLGEMEINQRVAAPVKVEPPKNMYRYKALNWLVFNPESVNRNQIEPRGQIPTFSKEEIQKKYGPLQMGGDFQHDKWIVLTSIFAPTDDVKFLAQLEGWRVVVVGDTKTPPDWKWANCDYISVDFQEKMGLQLPGILEYRSYTRKNTGYLYAIAHGARIVYETDDDNRPTDNLKIFQYTPNISGLMFAGSQLFNAYQYFGQGTLWQRGYPLGKVGDNVDNSFRVSQSWRTPMIQQGVVNGDPDVDAVFRLTRKLTNSRLDVTFDPAGPPVILAPGVFSPYNTQNTLLHREALWSLFIPPSLNFRTCDIWRSYFAQRLLWEIGGYVAFYPPNAYQQRNSHDLMTDMSEEDQMYFTTQELVDILYSWTCPDELSFFQCFYKLIVDLVDKQTVILAEKDIVAVKKWIEDIVMLGYEEPKRVKMQPGSKGEGLEKLKSEFLQQGTPVYFAAAEQKEPTISWQDAKDVSPAWKYTSTISTHCPGVPSFTKNFISAREKVYDVFKDVLLIIYFKTPNYDNVKNLEVFYRSMFPNIAYCGKDYEKFKKTTQMMSFDHKQTFIEVDATFSADHICTAKALQMNYQVSGYLTIRDDVLINLPAFVGMKKESLWITSNSDKASDAAELQGINGEQTFNFAKNSLLKSTFGAANELYKLTEFNANLKNLGSTPYAKDPVYYIPRRLGYSAQFYLSHFGESKVNAEIAVLAVLQNIDKLDKFGQEVAGGNVKFGASHGKETVCKALTVDNVQDAGGAAVQNDYVKDTKEVPVRAESPQANGVQPENPKLPEAPANNAGAQTSR